MSMCACIMNEQIITFVNSRKFAIYSKFITVFTERSGYIVNMITRRILFAKNGNMMISAIDSRTHEVCCAGIHTNVLFVGVFLMNSLSHQSSIRSHHVSSQLCAQGYITHASRYQHLFVYFTHSFANDHNIIRFLIRLIRDTDSTGQIDERNMCSSLFLQTYRQLE